jgi:hypothetical protein
LSAVVHCECGDSIEVSASWKLRDQIQDIEQWLTHPENAAKARGGTLDIGFDYRVGDGNTVQGEIVPLSFMQRLVAEEIGLWISIYPASSSKP